MGMVTSGSYADEVGDLECYWPTEGPRVILL